MVNKVIFQIFFGFLFLLLALLNIFLLKTTFFQSFSYNNASNDDQEVYFKIMPNPAQDILNVEWSSQHNESMAVLYLINASGKKCHMQKIYPGNNPINISNLPSGIYFAIIQENGKYVFYQKFIKK